MALSHVSKIFAIQALRVARLVYDPVGVAGNLTSTATLTLSGAGSTGGTTPYAYQVVPYNVNGDAIPSTATTVSTGQATLSAASPITLTLSAAYVNNPCKVVRTNAPAGLGNGLIGFMKAGDTTFTDTGLPVLSTYTAASQNPAIGAAYNPLVVVPGSKTLELGGTVQAETLRGDFALLDVDAFLKDASATFTFAKANLDLWPILIGGTVTDSGTSPNQIAQYSLTSPAGVPPRFNAFKIEGQSVSADPINGDVHIRLNKCKLNSFPKYGMAEENYETFQASAIAVPRLSDGAWIDTWIDETATAIAA